ncbi:hypothetical protein PM082_008830 [Marasmius tenuissimus]|nr:hypothetical protein PM082_008830 [Marasmius tenuissimus]
MSSTTPSDFQTPTSTPANDNGPSNRGANYFFGFLITFVALLLIFIGCGIGTRRRLQRNGGLLDFDSWGDEQPGSTQTEPRLLEPKLTKGGEKWCSIQPLSTSLLLKSQLSSVEKKPDENSSSNARPLPPVRMPSSNPNAIHGLSLPVWVSQHRETKEERNDNDNDNTSGAQPGHDVMQVAILVEMPTQHREDIEGDEPRLHEYQLGVAQLSWDGGTPQQR